MRALLVRHAIAADRALASGPDVGRPLTPDGVRRFRRGARALAALVPELEAIFTSPLVRARQTADLLAAAHPGAPTLSEVPELEPGAGSLAILELLRARKSLAAVGLVGHEPDLSLLEGHLLTGGNRSLADFRKGGAALIDFPGRVAAGSGVLLWHLTAGQLRKLAP